MEKRWLDFCGGVVLLSVLDEEVMGVEAVAAAEAAEAAEAVGGACTGGTKNTSVIGLGQKRN